jgi:hypothetical protein
MAQNDESQDLEKNKMPIIISNRESSFCLLHQTTNLENQVPGRFKPTSGDDACFKLWNLYISQAQEYDKVLIESWKSDMDGMLLFVRLYLSFS